MMSAIAAEEMARMEINDVYSDDDLAECPETRKMMIDDSFQAVDDIIRPKLERRAEQLYIRTKSGGMGLLENADMDTFVGGLSGIVMNHLRPRLRREVVLQEPTESLAYLRGYFERKRAMSQR